jgi:hypothetical protein
MVVQVVKPNTGLDVNDFMVQFLPVVVMLLQILKGRLGRPLPFVTETLLNVLPMDSQSTLANPLRPQAVFVYRAGLTIRLGGNVVWHDFTTILLLLDTAPK